MNAAGFRGGADPRAARQLLRRAQPSHQHMNHTIQITSPLQPDRTLGVPVSAHSFVSDSETPARDITSNVVVPSNREERGMG